MALKKIVILLALGTVIGAFTYNALLSGNEGIIKAMNTVIVLFSLYAFNFLAIELLTSRIQGTTEQGIIKSAAKPVTTVIALVIIAGIWADSASIAIAGLIALMAVVLITGREFFLNFLGGIYLSTSKPFQKGDRIEIHGMHGDVIDYGVSTTRLMETGKSHTGRIVSIPNSIFLTSPSMNSTGDIQYVWGEIETEFPQKNAKELQEKIRKKIFEPILNPIKEQAEEKLKQLSGHFNYYRQDLEPSMYIEYGKNGNPIICLRFIVEENSRRNTESNVAAALEELKK